MRIALGDERLVAKIRAGDDRAFELLYDRYHAQLLAFCRHMLGSREEAEDALQHVFVSADRQLRRDDRPVRLKPWLYAIARNRCLSMLRARRETAELPAEPSTDGLAVAAEVEQRQELRETLEDLRRLPPDQRAALVLAELGDLSHPDIAAALDVRPEKVKALIFQAREALAGWRAARDADCRAVRAQLATLRGSALRRGALRRHVAVCAGCAAFEAEVARQRHAIALVLPVAPSVALKQAILGAALGTGEGAAGVVAASGAGAGVAAKAVAVVVAVAAGTGGGAVAVHELERPPARHPAAARLAVDPVETERAAAPPAVVAEIASPVAAAPARRPATPPGLAHRPARKGSSHRPLTPPGQAKRPATPPGQAKRGGRGKPAVAPGAAKRAVRIERVRPGAAKPTAAPGAAKRTAAPGARRRVAAPGAPKRVGAPDAAKRVVPPPGSSKRVAASGAAKRARAVEPTARPPGPALPDPPTSAHGKR